MKCKTLMQYFLPQHILSRLVGYIANCRTVWIKNFLIDWFIKRYKVDMSVAIESDPHKYETFNKFFIRAIKPELRPITQNENEIVCPIDGAVSQIGNLTGGQLIQAKGFYYDVKTLLGNDEHAAIFTSGSFATLYLSPKDYHRVHMPLSGKLIARKHIPGSLFSVNPLSVTEIPNLFSRNERAVSIFATKNGPMAMVLVGAMLVASIVLVDKNGLARGEEMGCFQFGSTVILLFPKNAVSWNRDLQQGTILEVGKSLGTIGESSKS
jgi:phosphatidylserine decarboxylase